MATKRKMHKFVEGDFITAEGPNKNISDDIRARALRSVAPDDSPAGTSTYGEENESPVTVTKTKTSVTSAKPKGESSEEYKTRMDSLVKKQALERVEPENYVTPGGVLKAGLKAIVGAGARRTAAELAAKQGVKQLENKATKMLPFDKAGSLATKRSERAAMRDTEMKRGNAKNYGIDPDVPGSASALDALRKDIGGGVFTMKKGGSVSSASKRGDGCAIRGKTRA